MIYKQNTKEWCQTCINGPTPNDDCQMCHITHVRPGSGPSIGQPTNWEEEVEPTTQKLHDPLRKNCILKNQ